ncbi:addiction module protein [Luteolibacter sp. Populi]|uniref:addiction module protein n=1 Tax=Luteolibacter sp. Populi TaxID=3230487 RepID=UPI0034665150
MPVSEKVQRLAESYSALSSSERLEFVSLVVPPDDHEVSSEWNEELLRRTREIDEGKVQLIDGDDFLSRLRAI